MSENQHLKRQLLHQAVADNVATIEGRIRASAPRERPSSPRWRWALAAAVPIAVVVVLMMLKQPADATPEIEVAAPADLPVPSVQERQRSRWAMDQPTVQSLRKVDPTILPLQVRHVVIDPGHGGEDHGTSGGDLYEKELTLDIGRRLRQLLEKDDFVVSMTRDTDVFLSLRERTERANAADADVFLSIHINWIAARQVRGVETYIVGLTDDPILNELARRENRNAGYSLADQDDLIQGILVDAVHQRSEHLANRVHGSLFNSLLTVNPKLQNRGVKTAPFVVLVATKMPAILAEVSCLSNADEAELLGRPLYREHIAEALYRGIRGYARDVNQSEEKGS